MRTVVAALLGSRTSLAYSLGRKAQTERGQTPALPFLKRAVELDPNFAMAYASMGVAYGNLNEPGRAAGNARKAYELRERVSERERLSIEAGYSYSQETQTDWDAVGYRRDLPLLK